ncbi:MAG: proline dehydrogenase family protein [Anaerolineae bacterium]|nr:proline dehydrogenase family protein [Anaerolineae bacterium]MCO5190859.1 proline dehydrogenase family protein [Anaerolineae bacterium]MCO5197322.1 proline dehydrogenase family protein [Anaerolineae bacterium]
MMGERSKSQTLIKVLPFVAGATAAAYVTKRNGEEWMRAGLLYLSHAVWAKETISALPPARIVAARFVAGETIEEAMDVTRTLNAKGMRVSLDYLGESVNDSAEAIAAKDEILKTLDAIAKSEGVTSNVSVKLTQLGLAISPDLAYDNMRQILERAREYDNWVRIDMEDTPTTDITLDIFRRLRDEDHFDNSGVVIQSYLYRSEADIKQLIEEGARVRLCKGAYLEPERVAFPEKAAVDNNFVNLMQLLLSKKARANGVRAGIATHDDEMIRKTIAYVKRHGISAEAFEFQMLYGIRRERQEQLVADGYNVRVYVPFGTAWYAYFMRRLAERPANLWFFVSNFFRR